MLVHPRLLLAVVGSGLITTLVAAVARYSPQPGQLTSTHAGLAASLDDCAVCHTERGLDAGCLSCHGEIQTQLAEGRGYHHHLIGDGEPACARCHQEHKGAAFPLVHEASWGAQVERAFQHPHVAFDLVGKHERTSCETCHVDHRAPPTGLRTEAPRERHQTFLGLRQSCLACHQDPHADGLAGDCARCHGQEAFQPPSFDHARHFPLEGGHADSDCRDCHAIPAPDATPKPPPFPFDETPGSTCESCHATPHHTQAAGCDGCHAGSEAIWTSAFQRVDAAMHVRTGFRLDGPHAAVDCTGCHEAELAFAERYRDPAADGYLRGQESCQGCHEDVHRGQFASRHPSCLDCHERHRFSPIQFGPDRHARRYPLVGKHAAVACVQCHETHPDTGARRFVGTPTSCRDCHQSAHGPQFAARIAKDDCTSCHVRAATTFRIAPFDHTARTGHSLTGMHQRAACDGCHGEVPMRGADGAVVRVRRYEDTPTACSQCHTDVHRGQFALYGVDSCNRCHGSTWSWKDVRFDHATQSRFRLEGAHAGVDCARCHVPSRLPDGSQVIQYRPLATECRSCHDIPTADSE